MVNSVVFHVSQGGPLSVINWGCVAPINGLLNIPTIGVVSPFITGDRAHLASFCIFSFFLPLFIECNTSTHIYGTGYFLPAFG